VSEERRRGLGRGLSALLGEEPAAPSPQSGIRTIAIARLHPGQFQPRRHFDEDSLKSLAESIAAQGVLQPLLVRRHPQLVDHFEILAGERRWRAAQRAQLTEVPVLVREIGDREALEVALVENVQRQDLHPLEEARGYQRLIDEFSYTQEALAARIGKSRSHLANMMRLLGLPDEVRQMLEDGRLTVGHARALLPSPDAVRLAHDVVRLGLTVRQTEALVQSHQRMPDAPAQRPERDPNVLALEKELSTTLGLRVAIRAEETGRGQLVINYRSLDQLDEVLGKLKAR
jgi:ParB family chromosome partitioning protein